MQTLHVPTSQRVDFVDITHRVQALVSETQVQQGLVTVYVPHTTCGITINEHADPDVVRDIQGRLAELVPYNRGYHHREGNADSHIKTSILGSSETVIIENGRLVLGTWQGIFLCDFDGPRQRKVFVKIMSDR